MDKTTIGTFDNRLKTEIVINQLKDSGIGDSEISCVYADREGGLHDSQTTEKVEAASANGAAVGAVALGIVGALTKLSVSSEDATIYENDVKAGKVLIVTKTQLATAKAILLKNGATNVREYASE